MRLDGPRCSPPVQDPFLSAQCAERRTVIDQDSTLAALPDSLGSLASMMQAFASVPLRKLLEKWLSVHAEGDCLALNLVPKHLSPDFAWVEALPAGVEWEVRGGISSISAGLRGSCTAMAHTLPVVFQHQPIFRPASFWPNSAPFALYQLRQFLWARQPSHLGASVQFRSSVHFTLGL